MKKFTWLYILYLIASPQWLLAQVAVNTDASTPHASAMLDIKSTSKGLLVPRLTSAQRTVIGTPADGLWVYDTDTKSFWYFKSGTGWQEVSGSATLSLPFAATLNSNAPLFSLTNNGNGGAFFGIAGTGGSGMWGITNNLGGAGILGDNQAAGEAVTGRTKSTGLPTGAVVGRNDGPGFGVSGFIATDVTGGGIGVLGRVGISGSTGVAGHFENLNGGNTGTALEVVTNGIGRGASVINTNPSNVANIFHVATTGPGVIADHSVGNAGNFFMNNTSGVGAGVRGEVNSIFGNNGTAGVYGVASGSGGYGGYFEHTSATGFGLALEATNAGLGRTADFQTTNATNGQATVSVFTLGTGGAATFQSSNNTSTANTVNISANGPGVIADHSTGNAGNFFMNNTSGVGAGVRGEVNSIFGNNGTAGVYGVASGSGGYGGYFEHTSATGFGLALEATNAGLGRTADFQTTNASNGQATVSVFTIGTGAAATFQNSNNTSTANTVNVTANGPGVIANNATGNAGNFFMNNTSGVGAGVRGEVNSIFGNNGTAGVYGVASGSGGYGGYFEHTSATGFGLALEATNAGLGRTADFQTTNASNGQATVSVFTIGTGAAATFQSSNNTSTANTVNVTANGPGVIANHATGNAGNFFMNNTSGVGGVRGEVNSIFGNNGTAGVYGVASGSGGYGGYFEHSSSTGFGIALQAVNVGQGAVLVADQQGSGTDVARFRTNGANQARIDRTGRGFFNGGTQTGGADVAEAFDVTGNANAYEPGDVLAIAMDADRTVQKSQQAYSSLVVGVYATKPGVLMTEESIDSDLYGKVPMGVVGVIPTKVCNENGAIHRGDILVSASRPGYAMKADLSLLKPGQAIGKALQEFEGETGKIKVLVNVR